MNSWIQLFCTNELPTYEPIDARARLSKTADRARWQVAELQSCLLWLFKGAVYVMEEMPIKLPSGNYEEEPKREKNQQEMNTEMERELLRLSNHVAYVKTGEGTGKLTGALTRDALAGVPCVNMRARAREIALNRGFLKKRTEIEEEIRERQEQWRQGGPGGLTPPTNTGGNSPPSLPSAPTGGDDGPPPISYIPSTPSDEKPLGTKSLASRQKDLPADQAGLPLEFVSLRFFESGSAMPPKGQRSYSTSFPKAAARYISIELLMENRLSTKLSKRLRVKTQYVQPDGNQLVTQEEDLVVHPDTKQPWYQWGIGAALPGYWKTGVYRVVIFIDGVEFAEESFTITDAEEPTVSSEKPSQVRNWALERGSLINDQPPLSPVKTPAEKPPGNSDQASRENEGAQSMTDIDEREEGRERQPGKIIDLSSHRQKQRGYEMANALPSPDANAYDPIPSRLSPALAPKPRQVADIELLALQFFESGEETILRAKRQYSAQFPQRSTRFIHFELTLRNHDRQREQVYQVTYRYSTLDGQLKWEHLDEYIVQSNWTRCWYTRGCGFADAGRWEPGSYRVEIFIDGVPFTEGSFTIEDDRPSLALESLQFFESGKDVPTKAQRQYNTRFPQETTRIINFELRLNNPLYGWRNQDFQLLARYYNPDRSLLWEVKRKVVIRDREKSFTFVLGSGDELPAYMPGSYRVEIFIDGVPFTEGSFIIEDDWPSEGSFTIEEDTPQAKSAPPSMKISATPSSSLAFESLKLFEAGTVRTEYEKRQYNTRFPQETTRFVYYEISIRRSYRIQKALTYQVVDRYYNPDGSLMGTRQYEEGVSSGYDSWRTVSCQGWEEAGHWEPGTYRVEIFINRDKFAEESFTIE